MYLFTWKAEWVDGIERFSYVELFDVDSGSSIVFKLANVAITVARV